VWPQRVGTLPASATEAAAAPLKSEYWHKEIPSHLERVVKPLGIFPTKSID